MPNDFIQFCCFGILTVFWCFVLEMLAQEAPTCSWGSVSKFPYACIQCAIFVSLIFGLRFLREGIEAAEALPTPQDFTGRFRLLPPLFQGFTG